MELFSPAVVGSVLALLGILVLGFLYLLFKQARPAKSLRGQPGLSGDNNTIKVQTKKPLQKLGTNAAPPAPGGISPWTYLALRLSRPLLLLASLVCAALFILAVIPQRWFESLARTSGIPIVSESDEPLWLESMGEEKTAGELKVFGVVRNVTRKDITAPQVVLKIYGMDGTLLSAIVAPMRVEQLAPQAAAEFSVVYQQNPELISRFAVSFKTADGDSLLHKDVRGLRPPS